ncbi:homoserine kinase [compost metagenome]
MLKLKYLFDNRDLSEMILKQWPYDPESLDMFKHYRISSNAIYPFRCEGKVQLLRFAPYAEKNRTNMLAELDLLDYLKNKGYPAMEVVISHAGDELVDVRTPWGHYVASVFRRVPGIQLNRTELDEDIVTQYGRALAQLHRASSEYEPLGYRHWTYADVLDWMQSIVEDASGNHMKEQMKDQLKNKISDKNNKVSAETRAELEQAAVMAEIRLLREYFAAVPTCERSYGLIHYDFEYDNVFYDEASSTCYAIDFDDAMYHWYVMDVEKALDSLTECIADRQPEGDSASEEERMRHTGQLHQYFMNGYLAERELVEPEEDLRAACTRFGNLYGYVRVLRAMDEEWEHEPDWMRQLRTDLTDDMKSVAQYFGQPLKSGQ